MSGTLVKICGVRSPGIARVVAESGADLMGLIFAPSRRQVSELEAYEIMRGLDGVYSRPKTVGVFVNECPERVNALAAGLGLDLVQLNGDEPVEMQRELERPVIRALRLPDGTTLLEAFRHVDRFLDCPVPAWSLLLDTHVTGVYGGTGLQGDWGLAQQLAERYPVILAGGLRPETVEQALRTVRPMGVDVSSGVETDGSKDPDKVREFIALVRSDLDADSTRSGANNVATSCG